MALPGEVTHLAAVVAALVAVLPPLLVVLELHLDLLASKVTLVISSSINSIRLDALDCHCVVLHVGEGEAVFGVAVSLGHEGVDGTVFLEVPPEFVLDVLEVSLGDFSFTFPSMFVMKSLLVWCFSSEGERCCRLSPLESLLSIK